ncbi:MAG: LysE/ArgO family amino acid transporter [Pseudomonadota bacterium]
MIAAALFGFLTGASLILAIGAQNAFVLRNGLMGTHVFALCLFCSVSDMVLMFAGVAGFGVVVSALPWLPAVMTLGGAAFLAVYGALRLQAAWRGDYEMVLSGQGVSLRAALLTVAAFTWLNPHVYLDTLGLVGAISTQYAGWADRWAFATGATLSSFVFFFAMGYGARLLAPVMQSARAWARLDVLVGVTMWVLAGKLVWGMV